MVEHCLAQLPNEGCGLLAMDGDRVAEIYPTGNDDPSPNSYTIPPEEHMRALEDAESRGWVLGGAFHSHPTGPAMMSDTDVAGALDPSWLYVVVSLRDGVEWSAWRHGEAVEI